MSDHGQEKESIMMRLVLGILGNLLVLIICVLAFVEWVLEGFKHLISGVSRH